jgi:hypothetical protein
LVSRVTDSEQHQQQEFMIFFEICGLYKGKALTIDVSLYHHMLAYISEQSEAVHKQASGFLKLSFENEVGLLFEFSFKLIEKFDYVF